MNPLIKLNNNDNKEPLTFSGRFYSYHYSIILI